MQNSTLTLSTLNQACIAANQRWSQKGTREQGVFSPDINTGMKAMGETQCAWLSQALTDAGIPHGDFVSTIANQLGVKAIKRGLTFIGALASGEFSSMQATPVLTVMSAALAGVHEINGAMYATTLVGNDSTSDYVKNTALVRKLHKALPGVSVMTAPTQLSNWFGKNGFGKCIGLCHFEKNGNRYADLRINKQSPFYLALRDKIERASPETLATMKRSKAVE